MRGEWTPAFEEHMILLIHSSARKWGMDGLRTILYLQESFVTFFFYMIFLKNEFPGYLLTVGV
jgi:hypothetical protein